MIQYIGMDAHMSTCSFCVMDETGREVDNTTLRTNGRLIIDYLRDIRGTKKLTFEECELSNWLYEILKDEVDELIVCNPVANKEYKKKKTDKLDARKLAKLLRGNFLTPVFHDGSKRERFRGLMSGYQDLVNETVRFKNRYKSLFRRSGINVVGEAIYKDRDLLKQIKRPDFRFIGIRLHYILEKMNESLTIYQQQIGRSKKHFKEIGNLMSIPGIGYIQAAKIVGQPLPLVLIGSAPTALEQLLDQLDAGAPAPSLVIGMPVGFVGVPESKRRLAQTTLDQIRLDGTRGGAGLVAAAVNALLRQVAS